MPRKNPLPRSELEIGQRVRIVRERAGFSRAAFARKVGGDSSTITNVEHGRAPLRFELAERICARFGVNPRWLATGLLPVNYRMHSYGYSSRIAPRRPFSAAYSEFLAAVTEKALKTAATKAGCRIEDLDESPIALDPSSPDAVAARETRLMQWMVTALGVLPPQLHEPFVAAIAAASNVFFRTHAKAIAKNRRTLAESASAPLKK